MINRDITVSINDSKCIGCGLCVTVCPSETISIKEGKAVISGTMSIGCGHCAAICPEEAISVAATNETLSLNTIEVDNKWMPPGEYNVEQLVRLMRSRRSCRNYKDKPVDRKILEDLIKIGISAPSGSNCQQWTFTIVPNRVALLKLGQLVVTYFKRLNLMASQYILRKGLSWLGKHELEFYYQEYYEKIQIAVQEFEESGKDRLFYGAPAAILVGSKPEASCPAEDALLATQNILLAAHAMGLGTCLIGFVVEALKRDPSIKKQLGLPLNENIYSVIAVGYPNETYQRIAGRKRVEIRDAS